MNDSFKNDNQSQEKLQANENLKIEKNVMRISLIGSIIFLIAEIVTAIFTHSHAVLMDCVYDLTDLMMLGPFYLLIPQLYKPVTERHPYGYAQVESLFIIIKTGILIFITCQLLVESIKMIIGGGHLVNAGVVAGFELFISATCIIMFFVLNHLRKKYNSPTISAELWIWKLDSLSTLGVGLAFIGQLIVERTPWAWLAPYVDPGIAFIVGALLLKEPISMFVEGIKNLILFAPNQEIVDDVRATVNKCLEGHALKINFLDVIKTGRKVWVEVYFVQDEDTVSITELKLIHSKIHNGLKDKFDQLYVEVIPEMDVLPMPEKSADIPRRGVRTSEKQEKIDIKKDTKKAAKAAKKNPAAVNENAASNK